jgi:NAD(P)-dependent dehydrogenase (short-subunit alcohol dehydrogenase family)
MVWEACDVRDPAAVQTAIARLAPPDTPLYAVICNAGVGGPFASVEEAHDTHVRELFDTNYFGVVHVLRAVLPRLRAQRSGRVLVTGSLAGRVPLPFQGHYAATKAALESLTFALHCELSAFGVAVSLIEPSDIRTPINDASHARDAHSSPYRPGIDRCAATVQADVASAPGPEVVAALTERVLRARRPRPRYVVGPSTTMVGVARRMLSDSINLWLVRRYFGL